MSPRSIATGVVVALIVLVFAATCGWNEFKTHRMSTIPIGATKAQVISALGQPDNSDIGSAFAGCKNTKATAECWTWKLFGQNYLSVCFDNSGRVVCHEAFSIWT